MGPKFAYHFNGKMHDECICISCLKSIFACLILKFAWSFSGKYVQISPNILFGYERTSVKFAQNYNIYKFVTIEQLFHPHAIWHWNMVLSGRRQHWRTCSSICWTMKHKTTGNPMSSDQKIDLNGTISNLYRKRSKLKLWNAIIPRNDTVFPVLSFMILLGLRDYKQ